VSAVTELSDADHLIEDIKFDLVVANILVPNDMAFELMAKTQERGIATFFVIGTPSLASQPQPAAIKPRRKLPPEVWHWRCPSSRGPIAKATERIP
jgi:hypothetical protein